MSVKYTFFCIGEHVLVCRVSMQISEHVCARACVLVHAGMRACVCACVFVLDFLSHSYREREREREYK